MGRAFPALVEMAGSLAVSAPADNLTHFKFPFSVSGGGVKEAKDYLLEVREIRRNEASSIVNVTITPQYEREISPDWLASFICFVGRARGKSYFTLQLQPALPLTYVVTFPEGLDAAPTERAGEATSQIRSVKICEPVLLR